jgi:hypothetical protein
MNENSGQLKGIKGYSIILYALTGATYILLDCCYLHGYDRLDASKFHTELSSTVVRYSCAATTLLPPPRFCGQ